MDTGYGMPRTRESRILDVALGEPTDRRTLTSQITVRLRRLIVEGHLPPGQPLRPAELAPRLGVSVMPIREALRILEAEGLVTFLPRRGARVAEIATEDVEELYLVRAALEGYAARLAVANLSQETLASLHDAFDQMTVALRNDDFSSFSIWDREFHRRHYSASGRPSLVKRILDLWDAGRRIYAFAPQSRDSMTAAYGSHRKILEALDRGDARAAERYTRSHTDDACEKILEMLAKTGRSE